MLNKYLGFVILISLPFYSYSQLDTVETNLIVDTDLGDLAPKESTFYIAGQFFNAHRNFEDLSVNQKFDSINSQESIFTGGIEMGVKMDLTERFYLTVAANYFGGGESWSYEDPQSDSTYLYVNKYRQVALPIRLNVQFGNQVKGFGFVGAIPSSILNRRFESTFTNSKGTITENDIVSTEKNINAFQFIGSVGGGVSYDFGETSIFAQIEYRHHFTNTYTGIFLSHNQKLLGGSIGLSFSF